MQPFPRGVFLVVALPSWPAGLSGVRDWGAAQLPTASSGRGATETLGESVDLKSVQRPKGSEETGIAGEDSGEDENSKNFGVSLGV